MYCKHWIYVEGDSCYYGTVRGGNNASALPSSSQLGSGFRRAIASIISTDTFCIEQLESLEQDRARCVGAYACVCVLPVQYDCLGNLFLSSILRFVVGCLFSRVSSVLCPCLCKAGLVVSREKGNIRSGVQRRLSPLLRLLHKALIWLEVRGCAQLLHLQR